MCLVLVAIIVIGNPFLLSIIIASYLVLISFCGFCVKKKKKSYTIVSRASPHSQVSTQVLVSAAWMESAHSWVSAQARSVQSCVWQAPRQLLHTSSPKGACIKARSTKHSYAKVCPTISFIVHQFYLQKQLNRGSRVTGLASMFNERATALTKMQYRRAS